ncbi:MAG: ATP-binding protein [Thermodesulfobacteriota bacterium]|nr:ATP-binding protein [Thermodesulfobacteriota bacterium]
MKENHYSGVRRSILGGMILVPSLPFVLVLGIGYYYFATSLQTSTISSMNRIVKDHRQMIDSFFSERKADLGFILHTYKYEDLTESQKLYDVFAGLQRVSSAFLDLGVFDEKGLHVSYQGPYKLAGRDYGSEGWFKEVLKEGCYISDVFLGYRRIPHFIIALAGQDGRKKWVIRATIDTYMFNGLVKKVHIGKTGESYLINRNAVFQTERRSGGNLMDKAPENIKYPLSRSGVENFVLKDQRGDAHCYATTWLKNKDWLLVVRQEKADAFRLLYSAGYLILLISIVGGGGIVVLAFYMTGRIVRRMQQMDMEKEKLGDQLIRAGRLAELGEMAAGFAHEINNPLQIMKSEQALMDAVFSELKEKGQLKESEDLAELEDSIAQIRLQIERCSKITHSILAFGRKGEAEPTAVDLRTFIPEVTGMVAKKAIVHGIQMNQALLEALPPVRVDPALFQQVLLNLLNNAIDAILERHGASGGEMSIEARPAENGDVEISVKDNGIGISPDNQEKIFRPFFTTKPAGRGTGLGLSVCYSIIDNMGGVMKLSSEKGVGTTVTILLPKETR